MAEPRKSQTSLAEQLRQPLIAAAVLGATVVSLFGINQSVQGLQGRVEELEEVTERIDRIGHRVDLLQQQTMEIARVRTDILEAICAANARDDGDVRECLRAARSAG